MLDIFAFHKEIDFVLGQNSHNEQKNSSVMDLEGHMLSEYKQTKAGWTGSVASYEILNIWGAGAFAYHGSILM